MFASWVDETFSALCTTVYQIWSGATSSVHCYSRLVYTVNMLGLLMWGLLYICLKVHGFIGWAVGERMSCCKSTSTVRSCVISDFLSVTAAAHEAHTGNGSQTYLFISFVFVSKLLSFWTFPECNVHYSVYILLLCHKCFKILGMHFSVSFCQFLITTKWCREFQ